MLCSSHPIRVEWLQEVHDALWATPDVAIDYHKLIRNHDVKAGPWRNNQRTISFWTPLKAPAFVCKMIGEVQRCAPLWQVPCPGTSVPAEKIQQQQCIYEVWRHPKLHGAAGSEPHPLQSHSRRRWLQAHTTAWPVFGLPARPWLSSAARTTAVHCLLEAQHGMLSAWLCRGLSHSYGHSACCLLQPRMCLVPAEAGEQLKLPQHPADLDGYADET